MNGSGEIGGHLRGSSQYRNLLLGLFFAGIATFAQLYSPQALLPQIAAQLRISPSSSALVLSASTVGIAIGVLPWSRIADRYGRVRALSVALVAATVIAILIPFTPTFFWVVALRFCEGLLIAGVPATAVAYLNEEIACEHASRAAATYVSGTTIGGLAGRLLSAPVAQLATGWGFVGWRAGMLTVGVLCLGCAVLFVRIAPRPRVASIRLDLASMVWLSLSKPRLRALDLQAFLLAGGLVATYNYLGFRLGEAPFDLSTVAASLIFVAYLAGTVSSGISGNATARFGRLTSLLGSIGLMSVGALVTLSNNVFAVIAGLVLLTAGFFAAHSVASAWTGAEATIGRAQATSLYTLAFYAGSSVFGWLGGVAYNTIGWGGTAWLVVFLTVGSAAIAATVLRRRGSTASTPIE